ncbi:MAG: transporter, partial [Candidatus Zixiibacteriota bacterium]
MSRLNKSLLTIVTVVVVNHPVFAQESAEDLAKQLTNPVAALISVPFQFNYDGNLGTGDTGDRVLLNIQPVVPITLNDEWNIISRTILPVIWQDDVSGDGNSV